MSGRYKFILLSPPSHTVFPSNNQQSPSKPLSNTSTYQTTLPLQVFQLESNFRPKYSSPSFKSQKSSAPCTKQTQWPHHCTDQPSPAPSAPPTLPSPPSRLPPPPPAPSTHATVKVSTSPRATPQPASPLKPKLSSPDPPSPAPSIRATAEDKTSTSQKATSSRNNKP